MPKFTVFYHHPQFGTGRYESDRESAENAGHDALHKLPVAFCGYVGPSLEGRLDDIHRPYEPDLDKILRHLEIRVYEGHHLEQPALPPAYEFYQDDRDNIRMWLEMAEAETGEQIEAIVVGKVPRCWPGDAEEDDTEAADGLDDDSSSEESQVMTRQDGLAKMDDFFHDGSPRFPMFAWTKTRVYFINRDDEYNTVTLSFVPRNPVISRPIFNGGEEPKECRLPKLRPSHIVKRHRERIIETLAWHGFSDPVIIGSLAHGEDEPGDLLVLATDYRRHGFLGSSWGGSREILIQGKTCRTLESVLGIRLSLRFKTGYADDKSRLEGAVPL